MQIEKEKPAVTIKTVEINGKQVQIDYTENSGVHIFGLNDRPFKAIATGMKEVEYRTNTTNSPFDFDVLKPGDRIRFINEATGGSLLTEVTRITHYDDAYRLYENEGLQNSSSRPGTIGEAVDRLESLTGYKEGIMQNGIYAIGIKVLTQDT